MKIRNIETGQIFHRLTVIGKVNDYINKSDGMHRKRYLCICSCPDRNTVIVSGRDLISGNVKSCGCYRRDVNRNTPIPIYDPVVVINNNILSAYYSMIFRLDKINSTSILSNRISIDKNWGDYNKGPKFFYDDMYNSYIEGYELQMIDPSKGFYPWNVEWKPQSHSLQNGIWFE